MYLILWITLLPLKSEVGSVATDLVGCPGELSKKEYSNQEIYIMYDLTFVKSNDKFTKFYINCIHLFIWVRTCICISL